MELEIRNKAGDINYKRTGYWANENMTEFNIHGSNAQDNTWELHQRFTLFDNNKQCMMYSISPQLKAYGEHIIKPEIQSTYRRRSNSNSHLSDAWKSSVTTIYRALKDGILMMNEIQNNDLTDFYLSFKTVQFYRPNQQKPVILTNKIVREQRKAIFEDDIWRLKYNDDVARWQLFRKEYPTYITARFRDIRPLQFHEWNMPILPHDFITPVTIQQITVMTVLENSAWNGDYYLYDPGYHEPLIEMKIICNELVSNEDITIYFKEEWNERQTVITHYQLIHQMYHDVYHRWMLKKYEITVMMEEETSIFPMIAASGSRGYEFKTLTPIVAYPSIWRLQTS